MVYEALKLEDVDLTLEVQQQLGDGVVRTIAMGSSEGLKRGLGVKSTGAPITVPVGVGTLGRIMDVLGKPQDEGGPIKTQDVLPIHRPAPAYDEQTGSQDLLETGIKVIDLLVPFAKGGKIGLFGGAGVGKTGRFWVPGCPASCLSPGSGAVSIACFSATAPLPAAGSPSARSHREAIGTA